MSKEEMFAIIGLIKSCKQFVVNKPQEELSMMMEFLLLVVDARRYMTIFQISWLSNVQVMGEAIKKSCRVLNKVDESPPKLGELNNIYFSGNS